jgi:hypothetical protein
MKYRLRIKLCYENRSNEPHVQRNFSKIIKARGENEAIAKAKNELDALRRGYGDDNISKLEGHLEKVSTVWKGRLVHYQRAVPGTKAKPKVAAHIQDSPEERNA